MEMQKRKTKFGDVWVYKKELADRLGLPYREYDRNTYYKVGEYVRTRDDWIVPVLQKFGRKGGINISIDKLQFSPRFTRFIRLEAPVEERKAINVDKHDLTYQITKRGKEILFGELSVLLGDPYMAGEIVYENIRNLSPKAKRNYLETKMAMKSTQEGMANVARSILFDLGYTEMDLMKDYLILKDSAKSDKMKFEVLNKLAEFMNINKQLGERSVKRSISFDRDKLTLMQEEKQKMIEKGDIEDE